MQMTTEPFQSDYQVYRLSNYLARQRVDDARLDGFARTQRGLPLLAGEERMALTDGHLCTIFNSLWKRPFSATPDRRRNTR